MEMRTAKPTLSNEYFGVTPLQATTQVLSQRNTSYYAWPIYDGRHAKLRVVKIEFNLTPLAWRHLRNA
uniref:Uncharacterized protein n=1 Tax=Pararge aegeria TaxID=116150 RepID=S4P7Y1_9NEOP